MVNEGVICGGNVLILAFFLGPWQKIENGSRQPNYYTSAYDSHFRFSVSPKCSQKTKKKNWQVWLSYAWLNSGTKRWPILFFHRWSMVMAVSVKNDCGDRNFATMVTWRHTSISISVSSVQQQIALYQPSRMVPTRFLCFSFRLEQC